MKRLLLSLVQAYRVNIDMEWAILLGLFVLSTDL